MIFFFFAATRHHAFLSPFCHYFAILLPSFRRFAMRAVTDMPTPDASITQRVREVLPPASDAERCRLIFATSPSTAACHGVTALCHAVLLICAGADARADDADARV